MNLGTPEVPFDAVLESQCLPMGKAPALWSEDKQGEGA